MTLLDMENKEGILTALVSLENDSSGSTPAILEEYLREIAKHGLTFIPWVHIKPLILRKFNLIVDELIAESTGNHNSTVVRNNELSFLRDRVYTCLSSFQGTPFTIQRLCELIVQPRKHYTRPDKFLRGFEKACLVVSTIDCFGNKIHNIDPRLSGDIELSSSSMLVNGSQGDSNLSSISSNDDAMGAASRRKSDTDEDDDENEENLLPIGASAKTIVGRRPCLNFFRPLIATAESQDGVSLEKMDQRANGSENISSDSPSLVTGAQATAIPGKHTLQRPFLSSSATSSSLPNEEHQVDEQSRVSEENAVEQTNQEKQQEETDANDPDHSTVQSTPNSTTLVPPIDQMLRPMGQLEAFVNTISMDAASSSAAPNTSDVVSDVLDRQALPSLTPDESGQGQDDDAGKMETTQAVGCLEAEAVDNAEETLLSTAVAEPVVTARRSLKRDSAVFDDVEVEDGEERINMELSECIPSLDVDSLSASPAKRPRVDSGLNEESRGTTLRVTADETGAKVSADVSKETEFEQLTTTHTLETPGEVSVEAPTTEEVGIIEISTHVVAVDSKIEEQESKLVSKDS